MWLVYLIGLLGSVSAVLIILLFLSIATGLFSLLEEHDGAAKIAGIVLVVSGLVLTFLPSERTAYMMLGAYGAQQLLEQPETATITQKILVIVNQELDSRIKK